MTGAGEQPPPRVTVAHPRTLASRNAHSPAGSGPRVADDLRRQTPLGDVYLRSLMRTQLRLGLAVVGVLVVVLGGLPILFVTAPGLRDATLAGVPLPWLITAVAVHPVLLVLAFSTISWFVGGRKHFMVDVPEGHDTIPPAEIFR